jgi:pilus assembly protein CpaC
MNIRPFWLIGAIALAAGALAAPGRSLAQSLAGGGPMAVSSGELRVNLSGQGETGQSIAIPRGKSAIVDLPVDARDVLVTDPKVADTVLRSPRKIYLMGLTPGQTDAVFFDAAGRRILALNIRVDQDFSPIADTIARIIPGAQVHVEAVNNSVVLSGLVANQADADRAVQIAQQFTSRPEQVLNMLSVAGKDQVMLKVRIVEVQRSVIKQLGFNLSATLGQIGSPQFLISSAAGYAVNGALLGGLTTGPTINTTQQPEVMEYDPVTKAYDLPAICRTCDIATTQTTSGSRHVNQASGQLQAFEQVGLVRTLAEPTLTTVSGEAAKFLAGGEFPVPTGEDTTGKVTVEFKPYGVGLGFTPVVLSGGRISLKISTEVSELTNQGSFSLSTSPTTSLTIPGLNVRRAETVVELPSGGAMMIAGLLKEETKQDIDSLPGLMNLPVLGALFRSRDYQEGETELVVIVTPYLVQPTNPNNLQTPADGLKIANDAETILMGHINAAYHAPPQAAAAAEQSYQGPVGYVIE